MRPIPRQANQQLGVFTTRQAYQDGWTERQLGHAAAGGALLRLRRGAYAALELDPSFESEHELRRWRLAQAGVAAALRIPAATVSHASAVALHGLPLLDNPGRPCITLQPPLRTREAGLHVHRQPIPLDHFEHRYEFRVTGVVRSCLDLTREFGLAAGLVAADAAVHRGLCQPADLAAGYRACCRGRPGLSSGRRVLELLDGNSESPLETISRLAMAGLPPPRTQVSLYSRSGAFLARVDFYWDDLGVVGEADGRSKYTDEELWREKVRQDALVDHGLVVERWGWLTARQPARLHAAIQQAFHRARLLRQAGIEPRAAPLAA